MRNEDKSFIKKIMPWLYLFSTGIALIFLIFFCSLLFHYDKSEILIYSYCFLAATLFFTLSSLYFGRKAFRHDSKEFWFVNVVFFVPLLMTLSLGEIWARFHMPPWPAIALHGADPSVGKTEWGRIQSLYPNAVGNNSWGQRDKERTIDPSPAKKRIAFVGDSFLEESSFVPVSMIVESELKNPFEVINLGVSTNGLLDYYWSMKNIAMKIGTEHVFIFFFMGNDVLLIKPSILSIILNGILSPPPRDSVLGKIVPGLSYYVTKKYRLAMSWVYNKRHYYEQKKLARFKEAGIEKFPESLLAYCQHKEDCLQKLMKKDLTTFYEQLTNPDLELFRSYTLETAVCGFCDSQKVKRNLSNYQIEMLNYTVKVLTLIKEICDDKSIDFTVVIVPQGFEVDDRLWEQWEVLNDFRVTLYHIVLQAEYLKNAFDKSDIDYINLYPVFQGTRGTYLNFDGHWSETGNELAANTVAEYIKNRYSIDSR